MAISKAKLQEMRENSAAGAARAEAKRQAELDKYMYKRNTEVANMMSTNEKIALVAQGRNEGLTDRQISEKYGIPAGSIHRLAAKAKEQGLIPTDGEDKPVAEQPGVIDAAELTAGEREKLTAEIEAAAGIVPDSEPDKSPQTDIVDVARYIKRTLQKALGDVPETVRVDFRISEGLCELEVADAADSNNTATLTWR